jgi:hypothetical protein
MIVTRQQVAQKLSSYLYSRVTLEELVIWAEQVMEDGDFAEEDFSLLRDIVSRIGLADVRAFGLTWEDCQSYLSRLGYKAHVTVLESA